MQVTEPHEPPLTEDRLRSAERQLGLELPDSYRRFLLAANGGRPKPSRFALPDGRRDSVDWFLGIHDGEGDNLVGYASTYRDRVPSDLLPIAHDPGGNLVCLGVAGTRLGQVFFWDHEREAEEGEPATYENVVLLAPDLDTFLDALA